MSSRNPADTASAGFCFRNQVDGLLKVFLELRYKIILGSEANELLQDISFCIKKIELRLVLETERTLKLIGVGVVGIEIRELDFAKILRFKPMNHGRHGTACTSGEAEKLHQLQLTGSQADRGRVGGFEFWSARGGDGLHFSGLCGSNSISRNHCCFGRGCVCWSGGGDRCSLLWGSLCGGRGRSGTGCNCQSGDQSHRQEKKAGFHRNLLLNYLSYMSP